MDFVIKNIETAVAIPKESQKIYALDTYKTVKDINGNDVKILDKKENVTIEWLQQRIAAHQAAIADLQAKIDAITTLPETVPAEGVKVLEKI